MPVDVLQGFLNARLFDVSGDDTRVARMREAASDVVATLKANPELIATFTMVGIDREVGPEEPLVRETIALLQKRWQSYAGAFSDQQLPTIARAIILQALSKACESDGPAAALVAVSRNLLPHIGSRTDEQIWTEMVTNAERLLEARSQREWGLPASSTAVPEFALPAAKPVEAPVTNRTYLTERMLAAAGPSNEAGTALKSANPTWPDSGETWSHQFGPLASVGIAAAIDDVVKRLFESVDPLPMHGALASALTDFAKAMSDASILRSAVIEKRSRLLWWKESLYSPSGQLSYRTLPTALCAALAAVDCNEQVGPFAPRAVEHLLREMLRSVDVEAMTTPQPLTELACTTKTDLSASGSACLRAFGAVKGSAGRSPLATMIAGEGKVDGNAIERHLGLEGGVSMAPLEFAVWLFRELQAAGANPPAAKRKATQRR